MGPSMNLSLPPKSTGRRRGAVAVLLLLIAAAAGAAYVLFTSNRLVLRGAMVSNMRTLRAETDGMVKKTLVTEGMHVRAGDVLLRLEAADLRDEAIREQQALVRMEAALGPDARQAAAIMETPEELRLRLASDERAEELARRNLQNASTEEAAAAVTLRRAMILKGQGQLSEEKYQAAVLQHQRARQTMDRFKNEYERQSGARAATSAKIRLADSAARSQDYLPLKAYAVQQAKVRSLLDRLEAAAVRAPADGMIGTILVEPGASVSVGQPVIHFLPPGPGIPVAVADVTKEEAAKLREGQVCQVAVAALGDASYPGTIVAVTPRPAAMPTGAATAGAGKPFQVRVAVHLPEQAPASDRQTPSNGDDEAGTPPSALNAQTPPTGENAPADRPQPAETTKNAADSAPPAPRPHLSGSPAKITVLLR